RKPYHYDLADLAFDRADRKLHLVRYDSGSGVDYRTWPVEEIGRRVELAIPELNLACDFRLSATSHENPAVRQQHRGRVMESWLGIGRHHRPSPSRGIPHFSGPYRRSVVAESRPAGPAGDKHLAVWQDCSIVMLARKVHSRHLS